MLNGQHFYEGGSRLVSSSLNKRVFCLPVYHATIRRQVFTADRFLHCAIFFDLLYHKLVFIIGNITVFQKLRDVAVDCVKFC